MSNSNANTNANMENLKNIIRQNIIRLGELKKVLEISLMIKGIVEAENLDTEENGVNLPDDSSQAENPIDVIASLTDKRGEIVDAIKNIDASIKHYKLQLVPQYLNILEKTEKSAKLSQKPPKDDSFPDWAENLYKLLSDQQKVLGNIKEADNINSEALKKLLAELENKTKSIKKNRILMDKFNQNTEIHSGTLLKKQK